MNKDQFISNFIKNVVQQNEENLKIFFNKDAQILWPCTNEEFNVSEYITANCKYPGKWEGTIIKIEILQERLIIVSKIYTCDIAFFVTSFVTLKGNKIEKLEEYWSDIGNAPQWRRELNLGKKIEDNNNKS